MIQIVLNLRDFDDAGIENKLRSLAKAQTDNPTAAPGLTITSVELLAAADLIKTTMAAQATAEAAAQSATTDKKNAVEAGKDLIRDYAPDVLKKTGKDPAKITLLDLDVRDPSAPPPPVPDNGKLQNLNLDYGMNPGELRMDVDSLPRMKSIEVQVNTTPNAAPSWTHAATITATPFTLTGLPAGAMVQVRARAIFADGPGPWSDIAEHRVP